MIAEIAPESGGESDGDVVVPRQCWAGEQGDRIVGAADKDGRQQKARSSHLAHPPHPLARLHRLIIRQTRERGDAKNQSSSP